MAPDAIERIAETHAAILFGRMDASAAIALARDLIAEDRATPTIVQLAALEAADGGQDVRERLDDVMRELHLPTGSPSVVRARVRWTARGVVLSEITLEKALVILDCAYSETNDPQLEVLAWHCENHHLATMKYIAIAPEDVLAEFREALFAQAKR